MPYHFSVQIYGTNFRATYTYGRYGSSEIYGVGPTVSIALVCMMAGLIQKANARK